MRGRDRKTEGAWPGRTKEPETFRPQLRPDLFPRNWPSGRQYRATPTGGFRVDLIPNIKRS